MMVNKRNLFKLHFFYNLFKVLLLYYISISIILLVLSKTLSVFKNKDHICYLNISLVKQNSKANHLLSIVLLDVHIYS